MSELERLDAYEVLAPELSLERAVELLERLGGNVELGAPELPPGHCCQCYRLCVTARWLLASERHAWALCRSCRRSRLQAQEKAGAALEQPRVEVAA